MANSLQDAVQTAIYDRLVAGVSSAPVYSVVPDKTQPPVVVISDSTFEQVGGKGSDKERHEVRIIYIVSGTSKRSLFALMQEGKAALHNQPITATGFVLSNAILLSSDERRDIDQAALVGEQTYLVLAEAA